jgi:twitching motility protein PilT
LIVKEEKKILSDFCARIPESVYGPDRVAYILENSSKLKEEEIVLLRKFVNRILTSMIERDASDIEIGGHGNEGYFWMRIYGKLERVKDLPHLILIRRNILQQQEILTLVTPSFMKEEKLM